MINSMQILLIVVITALTIILTVIGIQIFYILKEVRRSFEKVNKILEDASQVSSSVVKPVTALSNALTGFSGLSSLTRFFFKHRSKNREE